MSVMEQKPARTRRSFTDEFKRDAVAMVLDDGNKIVDVARRLGIGEGTLGNWVAQARTDRGEPPLPLSVGLADRAGAWMM
jgi:transposase